MTQNIYSSEEALIVMQPTTSQCFSPWPWVVFFCTQKPVLSQRPKRMTLQVTRTLSLSVSHHLLWCSVLRNSCFFGLPKFYLLCCCLENVLQTVRLTLTFSLQGLLSCTVGCAMIKNILSYCLFSCYLKWNGEYGPPYSIKSGNGKPYN